MLHARTVGIQTALTDHSLYSFADAGTVLTNKLLKFALSDLDHVICRRQQYLARPSKPPLFRTTERSLWPYSKENTVLRASLDPLMVSVIPNTVVAENFKLLVHSPDGIGNGNGNGQAIGTDQHPPPAHRLGPHDTITIIVISRLFYNKGTDLLPAAIPHILEN